MYRKFYGLERKPFDLTPDGNIIYLSEAHREGIATLRYGVIADKGFLMLTGGVGTTEKPDHNFWVLRGDQGSIRLRDWSVAERLAEDGSWQEAPDAMANEDARPLVLKGQLEKVITMVAGKPQSLATVDEALEVQEIVETLLTD